jgi:hypothetical protein
VKASSSILSLDRKDALGRPDGLNLRVDVHKRSVPVQQDVPLSALSLRPRVLRWLAMERARDRKLAIADALNRLDGAGLIERRGGRAIPSEVAQRLDELMTL